MSTIIVGAGYMAREYAKVLTSLGEVFTVVGRGKERIQEMMEIFPEAVCRSGGLADYLASHEAPDTAIVACNVDSLFVCTEQLIEHGTRTLLVEKPVALCLKRLNTLGVLARDRKADIFVAYNRRFYKSVDAARKLINEDRGILSIHFEFTEWVHRIDPSAYDDTTLRYWIISNSSHVIDTAFFLAGSPAKLHTVASGPPVAWHPSRSIFVGSGTTERGIPFTYHSNWSSAGRWSIEIMTSTRRLYLRPMERLSVQEKGSVEIRELDNDYENESEFKPGLYGQVKAFLNDDSSDLCSIDEYKRLFQIYARIGEYDISDD